MPEMLQFARGYGDKPFIVFEDQRLSYDDFYQRVDILASQLQKNYGVVKGDRVAIAMRNCPQWAISFVAGALCGAVMVPLNSWGKTDELMYGIQDCGAKIVVCDMARLALIEAELDKTDCCYLAVEPDNSDSAPGAIGDKVCAFNTVLAGGLVDGFAQPAVASDDPGMIMYTSGSTGFPKGAVHHQAAIPQAIMGMAFLGVMTMQLEGERKLRGGAEQETPLLTVPLFHGTGLVSGLLMPLQFGQKVVMMYKWDTEKALQLVEREKITGITSVPAVIQGLFSHPNYGKYDTSSLFRISIGGAATPEGLPELIQSKIGEASRSTGWGMTETVAVGSTMSGAIYDLKPLSAGVKSPLAELRFCDSDGNVLPPGDIGELQMRGITVCTGYWNHPDATAEIFDGDWLKSGDLGRMDEDGFLHITGRIKEIVIRAGENIYPGEIENAAYTLDGVQEAVVFGVPDPVMGEELAMIVYARDEDGVSVDGLRAHLANGLAGFKVPKYIELRNQPLPKNITSKLFKRQMREDFIATLPR
ncbi:MAG: acyl--CoA ligase [Pseudomonadales bacterium]|nr:acyl--CoA ligase [Pseudomonadales bacterium]